MAKAWAKREAQVTTLTPMQASLVMIDAYRAW